MARVIYQCLVHVPLLAFSIHLFFTFIHDFFHLTSLLAFIIIKPIASIHNLSSSMATLPDPFDPTPPPPPSSPRILLPE